MPRIYESKSLKRVSKNPGVGGGSKMMNWAGNVPTSGGSVVKLRKAIFARDNYTCQVCGGDFEVAYQEYLRGLVNAALNRTPRPIAPIQAGHIMPFSYNGLNGLNVDLSNGAENAVPNLDQTRVDLAGTGLSAEEIDNACDTASYRPNYDANDLECQCADCNETLKDVLFTKDVILAKVARAKRLNVEKGIANPTVTMARKGR